MLDYLKKRFKRRAWRGIRLRLAIVSQLALLPFIMLRAVELSNEKAAAYETAWNDLEAIGMAGAERFLDVIDDARATLQVLGRLPQVNLGTESCRATLDNVLLDKPWAVGFHVADSNGTILCSTSPETIGVDIHDRGYFQEALRMRGFAVGNFIVGRKSSIPVIGTAIATGRNGSLHVLVATINLGWLKAIAAKVAAHGAGDTVHLLDGSHKSLARFPSQGAAAGDGEAMLVDELLRSKNRLVRQAAPGGPRRLATSIVVPGTRARLVIGRDETTAMAAIDAGIKRIALAWLAIALATLAMVWLYAEAIIVVPITILSSVAGRIGRGELDARVGARGWAGEFRELGATIDIMGVKLQSQIDELGQKERRSRTAAMQDGLTGIPNRRSFDAELDGALQAAKAGGGAISAIMIDVDHFKKFNDRYGHVAGDDALRRVASALAGACSGCGAFAARIGGEEFAALVRAGERDAFEVAILLRQAIHALYLPHVDSATGTLTASIGVASLAAPADGTVRELMAAADAALYAAKYLERDQIVRASELNARAA